ncbi:MAG: lysoplasmalogenase, partial [Mesorhizobium sp.]
FMASDGLLASEKFLLSAISPHRDWTRRAVWVLYYAAQLAITMGFLLG